MKIKLIFGLMLLALTAIAQKESEKSSTKAASSIVEYGEPIALETAKKILNAAKSFAINNQWPMVIAIVDTGGNLVVLEKLDHTQIGSIEVAIGKAKTANNFKRPTKAFEDGLANGGAGLRVLAVSGIFPIEGGEPIIVNGKIIGAIGVSGMQPAQDGEVAKAGLALVK